MNAAGDPPVHKRLEALDVLRAEACPMTDDGRVRLSAARLQKMT